MVTTPFNYAEAIADADELLAEFGQAMTLRKKSASAGPDWAPTISTTDYPTIGVIVDLARWYSPNIEGTDVLRTDRSALVSASALASAGVTISKLDALLTADGTVYRVVDVKPVSPAGTIVLYNCWVRI